MIQQNKVIVMDIDGTLCPIKDKHQEYEDVLPFPDMLMKLRDYKSQGFHIILSTSRNMRTYDGNLGLINKHTARTLLEWLDKHNIPYDEIYYGKPWQGKGGFCVDDKTIRPDEFLSLSYDQILKIVENKRS